MVGWRLNLISAVGATKPNLGEFPTEKARLSTPAGISLCRARIATVHAKHRRAPVGTFWQKPDGPGVLSSEWALAYLSPGPVMQR
jgi:hypothetical protein